MQHRRTDILVGAVALARLAPSCRYSEVVRQRTGPYTDCQKSCPIGSSWGDGNSSSLRATQSRRIFVQRIPATFTHAPISVRAFGNPYNTGFPKYGADRAKMVTPAKAGVQKSRFQRDWIPAFAGMTERSLSAAILTSGTDGWQEYLVYSLSLAVNASHCSLCSP